MNLITSAKITRVKNAVAGGYGDTITSDSVDMKGYSSVTFAVLLGGCTTSCTGTISVQQSHDDNSTDTFTDLLGSGIAIDDDSDNKIILIEVADPRERYVRVAVVRVTANIVIDGVVAIQTGPGAEPTTHDATTVLASELHASPAEGAA